MKEFLNDLGKVISEAAETVGEKAGEVIETQKLKSQIRTLERGNKKDYCDIGKMIYDKFKAGETVDAAYLPLCEAIEKREDTIRDLEVEIDREQ